MKAVLLTKIGTTGNLDYKSINISRPAKNEALIKVRYCGLNHLDILIRQGKRPGPRSFPHILGSEIVGEVQSVNGKNTSIKPGDTIAVYPWTFCGKCQQCLSGNENICDNGGTIGRTQWGGYAEYAVVPLQNLIKMPRKLSLDKICASLLAATTAIHLLDWAKVKSGSHVLVTGATGGVGTFVIQLLKNRKCKIIASTSHESKTELLKALGVGEIIPTEKIKEQVRKIYPGGIKYVIDIMGGAVWTDAVEALAKNGTMVFCATTLEDTGKIDIGYAFSRQVNILGSYGGTRKDLDKAMKLLKTGKIKPVIDCVYPLKNASDALAKLDKQKAFGKIILRV